MPSYVEAGGDPLGGTGADTSGRSHTGGAAYGVSPYFYGGTSNADLYNQEQAQWQQLAEQGVTPTSVDAGLYNNVNEAGNNAIQSQQGQYDALGLMRAYAQGAQTPAQMQAQQALQYNQNAQRAMAANAGGGAALAAARNQASQSAATSQSMNANQMNALKAQEQQNYTNQYLNQANAIRENENKMYGIMSDAAYGRAQNQMDINKANDALSMGYAGLQNAAIGAQRQVALGQGQFNLQQGQINAQQGQQIAGATMGALSGASNWLSQFGSSGGDGGGGTSPDMPNESGNGDNYGGDFNSDVQNSDERMKTDIARTSLMRPFLDTLAKSRSTYRYKNPADEPRVFPTGGRYAGVMAQDLEKVPEIGHQLVIDTPGGKKVDVKTSLSAVMAGLGDVHERVARLEGHRYER